MLKKNEGELILAFTSMVIIEEFKKQEIMAIRGPKELFNNAFSHPVIVDKDSVSALSRVKRKLKTARKLSSVASKRIKKLGNMGNDF